MSEAIVNRLPQKYKSLLKKVEQGDADYAAGRIVSMDEVKKRTQLIIDRAMQKKKRIDGNCPLPLRKRERTFS